MTVEKDKCDCGERHLTVEKDKCDCGERQV